jgi:hypothetical protein
VALAPYFVKPSIELLIPEFQAHTEKLIGDFFQQGDVHKEYDLVVATVDSNYKYNKSPTAKSACINNIKLHILGKGIKNFYSKGLGAKVQLLNNFIVNKHCKQFKIN